jgi:hypothetical protein
VELLGFTKGMARSMASGTVAVRLLTAESIIIIIIIIIIINGS